MNTEKAVVNQLEVTEELVAIEARWDLRGKSSFSEFGCLTSPFCSNVSVYCVTVVGLTIKSLSLNWMPDNAVYFCSQEGEDCGEATGMMNSIMRAVSHRTNITIRHNFQLDGDWGLSPKSGTSSISLEFCHSASSGAIF